MTQMRRAKGSTTPVQYPTFDSPTHHGWIVDRIEDGVMIWALYDGDKVIAKMKPSIDNLDFWNVAINAKDDWQWFEFTGTFEYITAEIKRLYDKFNDPGNCMDFVDGPLNFGEDDDQIFAAAIDWDCDEESPDYPETTLEHIGLAVR